MVNPVHGGSSARASLALISPKFRLLFLNYRQTLIAIALLFPMPGGSSSFSINNQ